MELLNKIVITKVYFLEFCKNVRLIITERRVKCHKSVGNRMMRVKYLTDKDEHMFVTEPVIGTFPMFVTWLPSSELPRGRNWRHVWSGHQSLKKRSGTCCAELLTIPLLLNSWIIRLLCIACNEKISRDNRLQLTVTDEQPISDLYVHQEA